MVLYWSFHVVHSTLLTKISFLVSIIFFLRSLICFYFGEQILCSFMILIQFSFGYEENGVARLCRFHIMCYILTGLQYSNPIDFPMQNSMFLIFGFTCFRFGVVCLNIAANLTQYENTFAFSLEPQRHSWTVTSQLRIPNLRLSSINLTAIWAAFSNCVFKQIHPNQTEFRMIKLSTF